jgi:hypothetical protein
MSNSSSAFFRRLECFEEKIDIKTGDHLKIPKIHLAAGYDEKFYIRPIFGRFPDGMKSITDGRRYFTFAGLYDRKKTYPKTDYEIDISLDGIRSIHTKNRFFVRDDLNREDKKAYKEIVFNHKKWFNNMITDYRKMFIDYEKPSKFKVTKIDADVRKPAPEPNEFIGVE